MTGSAEAAALQGGEDEKDKVKEADRLTLLMGLLGVVLLLWGGYWLGLYLLIEKEESRGAFGDMFGGINALFSAGAFAGLIYTVLLQRKELRLQREELRLQREELVLTRKELRGQKVQLRVQNSVLRLQAFENTFFEMMRRHEDIVNAIEVQVGWNDPPLRGRRAFQAFYNDFKGAYSETLRLKRELGLLGGVQHAYAEFFDSHQNEVGHYFRNLYHMVKLVAEMDTLVPQRKHIEGPDTNVLRNGRYSALIRAQLSTFEHLLLFYNGVSEYGIEKFKPLIERFALLENMPVSELVSPHHLSLYSADAYGDMPVPGLPMVEEPAPSGSDS